MRTIRCRFKTKDMRIKINDKIYRLKEIESGVDSLMELVEEPKYNHGDFLMTRNRLAFIFDREGENGEAHHLFCTDMGGSIKDNAQDRWRWIRHCGYLKDAIAADQEAINIIHDGLKSIGKRWNSEKKCVEDIPKRKFKAGDKVRIKDGISSKTHRGEGPGFVESMDEYIGKELIVEGYDDMAFVKFLEDGLQYAFDEDWLEPWSDEPNVGDWVIYWDRIQTAKVGILNCMRPDKRYKYVVDDGGWWEHAVKWNGTKEHIEKIRSGKV